MKTLTCCFTGHRFFSGSDRTLLIRDLRRLLPSLAASGVTEFICGGALGFDTLAAQEVLQLKNSFPDVRLSLVLPCRTQADRWTEAQKAVYDSILERADETECLFDHYVNGCMQIRNRRMVDRADICIAYYTGRPGGTAYTVEYAKTQGVRILFLAQEDSVWEV